MFLPDNRVYAHEDYYVKKTCETSSEEEKPRSNCV